MGLNVFKSWGKMSKKVVDATGEHIIEPGMSKLGGIAGTVTKKVLEKGADGAEKLSKIDYRKLGKNALDKGKKIGVTGLYGIEQEAEFIGDSINLLKYQLLGDAPITKSIFGADHPIPKWLGEHTALLRRSDESLLGVKATGKGMLLAIPGALALGTPKAIKTYADMYRGEGDGQLYTNTPINTYGKALGNSYANNAGATGDLVFALHNQRHTGII